MTIPEQAIQAACAAINARGKGNNVTTGDIYAMLEAAAPHLAAVQVKKIGYVSAAELHTLQQIETCVDLFTVAQTGPMEFVPVYVLDASAADCSCTLIQQDETCPVGYPSLLCEICDGKGVVQPSVCQTCNGRGIIGGLYRVGDGDVDGWEEPCPACEPSTTALEAGRRLEEFLKENEDSFFDSEIQTVKDAINALSTLPVSQPSAGRAAVLEEEEFAIDKLRFRAFHTNSEADRQAYFDAVSKWFQDRHYRRMDAERALHPQADKPNDDGAQGDVTAAAIDVLAERRRQIEAEGWTPEHDDTHAGGEMAFAAASYVIGVSTLTGAVSKGKLSFPWAYRIWPRAWDLKWWKPSDRRRNLVKACALILAEIERLDRLPSAPSEGAE